MNTKVKFTAGRNIAMKLPPHVYQAETWLEVVTNDLEAAAEELKEAGVVRCDEIEPLPQGLQAFWISSPASIIHLVCKDAESWD